MKVFQKFYSLVFFTVFITFYSASTPKFSEGVKAFENGEYKIAAQLFEEEVRVSPNDVSAYYNLGLSKMETDKIGEAIWAFESVLQLNPRDGEAKEKIIACYEELNTNLEWTPRIGNTASVLYSLSSNNWSILAIICSCIIFIAIVLFHRMNVVFKRIAFVVGFFSGLFLIVFLVMAMLVKQYHEKESYAIVTQKTIPTFIDERTVSRLTLEEGTQLYIIEKENSEYAIVANPNGEKFLVMLKHLSLI